MSHIGVTVTIIREADLLPCGHPQSEAHTCQTIGILCHAACGVCRAAYRVIDQQDDSVELVGVAAEEACPTMFHGFPTGGA